LPCGSAGTLIARLVAVSSHNSIFVFVLAERTSGNNLRLIELPPSPEEMNFDTLRSAILLCQFVSVKVNQEKFHMGPEPVKRLIDSLVIQVAQLQTCA
jgi:hypothetical protein